MFAGWLTRVKVLAASSQCTAAGPGLESATVRSFAVFTIEARDAEGNRKGTGGDSFHVQIRLVSGGEAGGEQTMPRLAAQPAWRVGTGQLNALVLAEPHNEDEKEERHCVAVSQQEVGLIRLSSVGSVPLN